MAVINVDNECFYSDHLVNSDDEKIINSDELEQFDPFRNRQLKGKEHGFSVDLNQFYDKKHDAFAYMEERSENSKVGCLKIRKLYSYNESDILSVFRNKELIKSIKDNNSILDDDDEINSQVLYDNKSQSK